MLTALAIDTSTDACSVGLISNEGRRELHRILPRAHNKHVLSQVEDILETLTLDEIDLFVCGVGPGSFTGLRIATSVIQGYAWATDKGVVGVCSLEVQAAVAAREQRMNDTWILSATNAQIGQVYWRWFRCQDSTVSALSEPVLSRFEDVALPPEVNQYVAVGSGCAEFESPSGDLGRAQQACCPDVRPRGGMLAELGLKRAQTNGVLRPAELQPRYVQMDVGWKKLAEQPSRV